MAYYGVWRTTIGKYATISQSYASRRQIDLEVQDPIRNAIVNQHYETSQITIQPAVPSSGEMPGIIYDIPDAPEITFMDEEISDMPIQVPIPTTGSRQNQTQATNEMNSTVLPTLQKRLRKERKCWKCFAPNCPGIRSKGLCPNACTECGDKDCKGKDSRHPGKPCEKNSKQ